MWHQGGCIHQQRFKPASFDTDVRCPTQDLFILFASNENNRYEDPDGDSLINRNHAMDGTEVVCTARVLRALGER